MTNKFTLARLGLAPPVPRPEKKKPPRRPPRTDEDRALERWSMKPWREWLEVNRATIEEFRGNGWVMDRLWWAFVGGARAYREEER